MQAVPAAALRSTAERGRGVHRARVRLGARRLRRDANVRAFAVGARFSRTTENRAIGLRRSARGRACAGAAARSAVAAEVLPPVAALPPASFPPRPDEPPVELSPALPARPPEFDEVPPCAEALATELPPLPTLRGEASSPPPHAETATTTNPQGTHRRLTGQSIAAPRKPGNGGPRRVPRTWARLRRRCRWRVSVASSGCATMIPDPSLSPVPAPCWRIGFCASANW